MGENHQDPAEPYKVDEAVPTESQPVESPLQETPTETTVETDNVTVTESPAETSSDEG